MGFVETTDSTHLHALTATRYARHRTKFEPCSIVSTIVTDLRGKARAGPFYMPQEQETLRIGAVARRTACMELQS